VIKTIAISIFAILITSSITIASDSFTLNYPEPCGSVDITIETASKAPYVNFKTSSPSQTCTFEIYCVNNDKLHQTHTIKLYNQNFDKKNGHTMFGIKTSCDQIAICLEHLKTCTFYPVTK